MSTAEEFYKGCLKDQIEVEEYDGDVSPIKCIQLWTEGETKILLDNYYNFLNCIGTLKKFKNKKEMWMEIGKILEKTWKQCEQRYKTVIRRKKVAVENNRKIGSSRTKIEFEDELRKIAMLDDSIEPEIQISSKKIINKCVASSSPSTSSSAEDENIPPAEKKIKKNKSVQETIWEIHALKEAARDRRHMEKIEKAEKIEQLLNKLIDKTNQAT